MPHDRARQKGEPKPGMEEMCLQAAEAKTAIPPDAQTADACVLLCCMHGEVSFCTPKRGGFLSKGHFCLLPAEEQATWHSVSDGAEACLLHLPAGAPGYTAPAALPLFGMLDETLSACVAGLQDACRLPEPTRRVLTRVIGAEFLASAATAAAPKEQVPLGERVMAYVDGHLSLPLSLDELARRFFVSKFYLCRSFKAYAGESLHGYRTRRRVESACRLMASGETAASAAWKMGFGDYSAFYRACKKHCGCAPTDLAATTPLPQQTPKGKRHT